MILDVYDDYDKSVWRSIEKDFLIPQSVKQASIDADKDTEKVLYAYPQEKRFPLDTPEDITLSWLYFNKTASQLPYSIRDQVENKIRTFADVHGVNLDLPRKYASVKEIWKKEDFAVAIPLWNITDQGLIEKNASYINNDYLLLYPINTPENVKMANMMFPEGLDGPLEVFRTKVARKIASLLPEEEWSKELYDYLPMPKSLALDQVEARKREAPKELMPYYDKVASILDDTLTPNRALDFAYALEQLDRMANMPKYANIMPAMEFTRMIYDDVPEIRIICIADTPVPFDMVKAASQLIGQFMPEITYVMHDRNALQSHISSIPRTIQEYLLGEIEGYGGF